MSLPPMTWLTMASDASPGTALPVALMSAASVTSGEPAAGGWAANPVDPVDPVDAPVDDPARAAEGPAAAAHQGKPPAAGRGRARRLNHRRPQGRPRPLVRLRA